MIPNLPASGLPTSTSHGQTSNREAEGAKGGSKLSEEEWQEIVPLLQRYQAQLGSPGGTGDGWLDAACQGHRKNILLAGSCKESCPMNGALAEGDEEYVRQYCQQRNIQF